jgi:hypothetical protein
MTSEELVIYNAVIANITSKPLPDDISQIVSIQNLTASQQQTVWATCLRNFTNARIIGTDVRNTAFAYGYTPLV